VERDIRREATKKAQGNATTIPTNRKGRHFSFGGRQDKRMGKSRSSAEKKWQGNQREVPPIITIPNNAPSRNKPPSTSDQLRKAAALFFGNGKEGMNKKNLVHNVEKSTSTSKQKSRTDENSIEIA